MAAVDGRRFAPPRETGARSPPSAPSCPSCPAGPTSTCSVPLLGCPRVIGKAIVQCAIAVYRAGVSEPGEAMGGNDGVEMPKCSQVPKSCGFKEVPMLNTSFSTAALQLPGGKHAALAGPSRMQIHEILVLELSLEGLSLVSLCH